MTECHASAPMVQSSTTTSATTVMWSTRSVMSIPKP
jgi:hypothetical protein